MGLLIRCALLPTFIFVFHCTSLFALAANKNEQKKSAARAASENASTSSAESDWTSSFRNQYPHDSLRPRGGWGPVFSFFLPGIDQFVEGQTAAGATYLTYGVSGVVIAMNRNDALTSDPGQNDIGSRDNAVRQYMLGWQMYQTAGALSAYQAYRSTIQTYRESETGYGFIKSDDTTLDLAWAPFDFRFLARPTTFVPLGLLLAATVYAVNETSDADRYLSGSDYGYTAALSYQAGVSEEAIFRGWLMPSFRDSWKSDFWSNSTQATIFALLHISDENPYPVAQFLVGYYLGWLTQQNRWSLRESIFIHAWWDVIAFTGSYLLETKKERQAYLPLLTATW